MTVCSDAESIVRGLRAGIAGCVFKPFRIRDLVTTCDRILWRRGLGLAGTAAASAGGRWP